MDREKTLTLKKFILQYIVPMFLIALLLVLVSYFNDMRQSEMNQQLTVLNRALEERDERITALESRVAELEIRVAVLEKADD